MDPFCFDMIAKNKLLYQGGGSMNVYDFDNTIYRGESAVDLFWYYLKQDKSLLRYVPEVAAALVRYKRGKITIEEALSVYGARVADYFLTIPDFEADLKTFWDTHMKNIKPFYARLHRPDDVILSASPERVLEEACRRLGIAHWIGTQFDEQTGTITRLCFRENKVSSFLERFPHAKIEQFYTDSFNDQPMIDLAEHAFLVKGNRIRQLK